MENNQQDPNKPGSMTVQKTNEDFNKKKPDPKDPNEVKAEPTPEVEVPDLSNGKEITNDLRMNNEDGQENEVKYPEIIDEDAAAEDVEDDINPDKEKVKRSNDVKM